MVTKLLPTSLGISAAAALVLGSGAPSFGKTISVRPDQNLQGAIVRAFEGDVIELQDGTFTGGADLSGKNNITIKAVNPGKAILSGGQIIVSGTGCTLQGFQVVGVRTSWETGAVLVTGKDNRLLDLDIHDNESLGIDVSGGDGTLIERVKSNHNGNLGLNTGSPTDGNNVEGLTIRNSEFRDNNYGMVDPVWKAIEGKTVFGTNKLWYRGAGDAAGGVKICNARDVLVEDVEISGNTGAGLWFDVYCGKKTVRRVKVYGQKSIPGDPAFFAVGIEVELENEGSTLIEDCYSYDNAGSEYAVFEASNVVIRNCLAGGDVEFRDLGGGREAFRPRKIRLENLKLTGKVHFPNNRTRYQVTLVNVQQELPSLPEWKPTAPPASAPVTPP